VSPRRERSGDGAPRPEGVRRHQNGRVAVVTGGSGGIGFACGRVLAERGYDVLLVARRQEPLEKAAAEIGARWAVADCAEEADVARAFAHVERVDYLVHCAGTLEGTYIRRQQAETFDGQLRSHLRSAYLAAAAAVKKMEAGGRIVFVSSTAGLKGMEGLTGYSAAKGGINAMAGALAAEVEGDGIQVHILVPAPVDTPMLENPAFPMHCLEATDVAQVVGWLDELRPAVVIREVVMRSVVKGPFAPEPLLPKKMRGKG